MTEIKQGEWEYYQACALHMRPKRLVEAFYQANPDFKPMMAFRVNLAHEYEGVIQGFIADVNEYAEMGKTNDSLWIPVGVMSNAGDFVNHYTPEREAESQSGIVQALLRLLR